MPNKATAAAREAIAAFAEANVPKLQTWLDEIAAKNPARAAGLLLRALEYHIPKISRTEFSGQVQTESQVHHVLRFVNRNGNVSERRAINGEASLLRAPEFC